METLLDTMLSQHGSYFLQINNRELPKIEQFKLKGMEKDITPLEKIENMSLTSKKSCLLKVEACLLQHVLQLLQLEQANLK